MTESRGLITDTERERISGEADVEKKRKYEAVSRVRRRIRERLPVDMMILEKHHPQLLEELRGTVCKGETQKERIERLREREAESIVDQIHYVVDWYMRDRTSGRAGISVDFPNDENNELVIRISERQNNKNGEDQ